MRQPFETHMCSLTHNVFRSALIIVFSVVVFVSVPREPAHAEIIWAVAGPETGPGASFGLSQLAGIKQAVSDINGAGGISGETITLKTYDDACDPKQSVAIANKIISANISFVLNATCSASGIAAQKTYKDEAILVINPLATNPKITDDGWPLMFRSIYRDDNAAQLIGPYIAKNFSGKRIAILNDQSTYGLSIASFVQTSIRQNGVKEISFETYDPSSRDYGVTASRVKDEKADVLFVGGFPNDIALMTRQLRAAGANTQIIAGDLSVPEFWKIAGSAGENALFAFPTDPRKVPAAQKVIKTLEESGVVIDGYTLYAYAAAQVLAEALNRSKSTDPLRVAELIHKEIFETILGKWSFDTKGDVRNIKQVMYAWHDGAFGEVAP